MDKLKVLSKTTLILSAVIFVLVIVNITLLVIVSKEKPPKIIKQCMTEAEETTEVAEDIPQDHPCRDFRLSKHVSPLHYAIMLHPDMENEIFNGLVNITVNITMETSHIIFHAHTIINITKAVVYDPHQEKEIELRQTFRYDPNEFFVIDTEGKLKPGRYVIRLKFHGDLIERKVGLFKMSYVNSKNETRFVVASKFQPVYARRAFPCFDEPGFRSTYDISLVHAPTYIAISNMPIEIVQPYSDTGLIITKFQRSVPMVSYLPEFIVCDFKFTRTMSTKGKPMRVYSVPDKIGETQHALIFGRRVLDYYEYYFGVDYSLPKYDMIAFPDWISGATEHWGAVTFPERNLLYDEKTTLPYNMQRLTTVIAHEAVHMWFGNLVTVNWWNDIWVHEGFASYLEYTAIQELHPDWDIMSQFIVEDLKRAIDLDSTVFTVPIIKGADDNSGIFRTFRGTTYTKGASILRMMESFMGKETFRKGISNFLKKFEFKIVTTSDLWDELSAVYKFEGNYTFSNIMKPWPEEVGIPFVTIQRDGNNFVVKQKRYFNKDTLMDKEKYSFGTKPVWSIPLSYKTTGGTTGIKWIHEMQEKFTLPVLPNETIIFNDNHTGYYIVNYERQDWDKLSQLLITNHEALSTLDRSSLLFDSLYLLETVHTNFDTFLSLTRYLKNETHYVSWKIVHEKLIEICRMLEFTDAGILCKNYIYSLTEKVYAKIEWKRSKNHLENLLNPIVIELACYSRNQHCLTKSAEHFQNWTKGQDVLPELRDSIISFGMAEIGRDEHFNFLLKKLTMETNRRLKYTYVKAFAQIKVPHLIERFLQYLINKNDSEIFWDYLVKVSYNTQTRPFVISIIRDMWPVMKERFQDGWVTISRIIGRLSSFIKSESELYEIKALFEKHKSEDELSENLNEITDKIKHNIKWLDTYMEDIKLWFINEGVPRIKYDGQLL